MAVDSAAKGKKRAIDISLSREMDSPFTDTAHRETNGSKKLKRAETKRCPGCGESIPVRLLSAHMKLETQRLEEVISSIGSLEVLADAVEEGARSRRSAVKARKSLSAMSIRNDAADSISLTTKTIQTIQRRRKQRHASLREMTRDDDASSMSSHSLRIDITECPVCLKEVRGDEDVVNAHVDACLAYESVKSRIEDGRYSRDREDGRSGTILQAMDGVNLRGIGFDTCVRDSQDLEGEIDVDGDDELAFGDPQFTETDVFATNEEDDVDIDNDEGEAEGDKDGLPQRALEGKDVHLQREPAATDLAEGIIEPVLDDFDVSIDRARGQGNLSELAVALENKLRHLEITRTPPSNHPTCRICLDPYTEPTVSTGCWHTCCKSCWLRCLGSTRLCPICKRITTAAELRRIYL